MRLRRHSKHRGRRGDDCSIHLRVGNNQHKFAFWRMDLVVREKIARDATAEFFEFLGQLARDAELPTRQNVDASSERFRQAIGRFKISGCLFARGRGAQLTLALATFHRKKTTKEELFSRKSRTDQRGEDR